MSEQLFFLADNLFDVVQYPNATVSGQEEASGYEAFHVADGRRHAADRWSPTTANANRYIQVRSDTLRGADTLIVDRNSNLVSNARAGNTSTVSLSASDDNFTTSRSLFSVTIPEVPGGLPSGALGCVSDEDAWAKTFTADVHHDWRFTVSAMGAGVTPQLGGLWLGKAWVPTLDALRLPFEDEVVRIGGVESAAPSGWVGSQRPSTVRVGSLHIRMTDETDLDNLRYNMALFARGRPAWLAFRKTDNPWRMMLVRCPKADMAWLRDDRQWLANRVVDIPFEESQAVW